MYIDLPKAIAQEYECIVTIIAKQPNFTSN